jgi:hypothetical protein
MSFDPSKTINIEDCAFRPFDHEKEYIKCPYCGEAAEVNTSMVLTSYPAQYSYHCDHCDKHGFIFCHDLENLRIKTATIKLENIENALCTPCLICSESVPVSMLDNHSKICEKCKKAVLKVRKMFEEE